jgi:Predicted phosphohydrolases
MSLDRRDITILNTMSIKRSEKRANRKRWLTLFLVLIILITACLLLLDRRLDIENIEVHINNLPNGLKGLKVVHISDVHIPENITSINTILNAVEDVKPDIIVMTGDIIDKDERLDDKRITEFCKGMADIAPTYAVTGNHEECDENVLKRIEIIKSCGVMVLKDQISVYEKNGGKLAIIGVRDGFYYSTREFKKIDSIKSLPKILLIHRPELFYTNCLSDLPVKPDIVLSGHAHGGQFRIPFTNQGIAAPGQGMFPKYTSGLYKLDCGSQLIVSRGLGNSMIPVRINNRPHIPVLHLE